MWPRRVNDRDTTFEPRHHLDLPLLVPPLLQGLLGNNGLPASVKPQACSHNPTQKNDNQ